MVRTLPVVPLLAGGEQEFQPVWHEDLAKALVAAVERDDLAGRTLEVAGRERTTQAELVSRFAELTGRSPALLPLPAALARLGTTLSGLVGAATPLNESQLVMVQEGNVLSGDNALDLLGVEPTPLGEALERLAREQPETLPSGGVGAILRKRYSSLLRGTTGDAAFAALCADLGGVLPLEARAEPAKERAALELGTTITLELPLRGQVQVRVEELDPQARVLTLVTLEGHPLTGGVRFAVEEVPGGASISIETVTRAAGWLDFVGLRAFGLRLQDATWRDTLGRLASACGGEVAGEIAEEQERLDDEDSERAVEGIRHLVQERQREEAQG
jgi:NADH dehydrogenase